MIKIFKNIYLTLYFFLFFGSVVIILLFSFSFPFLFNVAKGLIIVGIALTLIDTILLFNPGLKVFCKRKTAKLFSLGSENSVKIEIKSRYNLPLKLKLIDEQPPQFQERNFFVHLSLPPNETLVVNYKLYPVVRGEYHFGKVHLFLRSFLRMIERRMSFDLEAMVPVYPSILEMKKLELKAFAKISDYHGIKRIRRLGHSYEFEQIKNYVPDDDFRSINWKATGRRGSLMVNQFEDEKAQQIYSILDKSRAMKMPFNKLSLLDYAINTSLVLSNIALLKQDKAGLLTFADKVHTCITANRSRSQLKIILEALYNEQEKNLEANYEALYLSIKNLIKGRSLIFLYTNFESFYAVERVLPVLRKINSTHLLVVVFFENTEVIDYTKSKVTSVEEIYFQTVAQKFVSEKNKIIYELRRYGIQAILTRPESLSLNTINKYLELKSRGMI